MSISAEKVDLCHEMLTRGRQFLVIISEELGGKKIREKGRCACVNGATCGDFSTSLSARSSNTDQEADESTLSDAQDDGDDGVCLDNLLRRVLSWNNGVACFVVRPNCKHKGSWERLRRRI